MKEILGVIKDQDWQGVAHLYKLDCPVKYTRIIEDPETHGFDEVENETEYVIASGVDAFDSGWEILVFPATSKGKVLSWSEIAGGRGMEFEEVEQELWEMEDKLLGEKALEGK